MGDIRFIFDTILIPIRIQQVSQTENRNIRKVAFRLRPIRFDFWIKLYLGDTSDLVDTEISVRQWRFFFKKHFFLSIGKTVNANQLNGTHCALLIIKQKSIDCGENTCWLCECIAMQSIFCTHRKGIEIGK